MQCMLHWKNQPVKKWYPTCQCKSFSLKQASGGVPQTLPLDPPLLDYRVHENKDDGGFHCLEPQNSGQIAQANINNECILVFLKEKHPDFWKNPLFSLKQLNLSIERPNRVQKVAGHKFWYFWSTICPWSAHNHFFGSTSLTSLSSWHHQFQTTNLSRRRDL